MSDERPKGKGSIRGWADVGGGGGCLKAGMPPATVTEPCHAPPPFCHAVCPPGACSGTLAGSTILLLSLAWGGSTLIGRCDIDPSTGKPPLLPCTSSLPSHHRPAGGRASMGRMHAAFDGPAWLNVQQDAKRRRLSPALPPPSHAARCHRRRGHRQVTKQRLGPEHDGHHRR